MKNFSVLSVLLTFLVFGLMIPIFEINQTHLFNPEWPSHARLHEAWQLMTNAAISALALYLIWTGKAPKIAIILSLIIGLSFLTAFALGDIYGGSMLDTNGTQKAVAGINLAVLIALPVTAMLLSSLVLGRNIAPHGEN
jgi:hypothetical protein